MHDYNLALTVEVESGKWFWSVDDGNEVIKAWPDDSIESRMQAERLLDELTHASQHPSRDP